MNRFTAKLQEGLKRVGMDIRRSEPRIQAYRPGRIVWPDLTASRDISILDMSQSGAKLTFGEGAILPDLPREFYLLVHGRGGPVSIRRVCEKRWQRDELVGVRFVQRLSDEDLERLVAAETELH